MKYLYCSTRGSMHACITQQQQIPAGLQIAGSDNKSNYNYSIGSHSSSNTARTNYRTRMVLLPALLAGGRRV